MAPFFVLYWRSHKIETSPSLSQRLEYFFASKYANWLVFFWAFGEALVWFVIPEFLLLLMVFMRISRKRQLLLYDIYGTAAGTLVALLIHLPEKSLAALPYIQPKMIVQVHGWYDRLGIGALVFQPFSGVPYKVFTHVAAEYGFFLPLFLIFAVMVRISRYYIGYTLFTLAYPALHKHVYRNYVPLFFIATAIFSLMLFKVYRSYAG
jgi:membrane protein YqaA with SNARE-associated domain